MPQTITTKDGTVLDAGVVNLTKAIRARESKGDYNAVGDAGTSKGAYQWQPGNFAAGAQKYGLDPNDFSPVNQDKVAYYQVKALKDKGYTPEQVAASWNAGEGSLKNDKWRTNVGTTTINGQQVHYDTPGYVNAVVGEFQKLKSGYNPSPYSSGGVGAIDFTGNTPVKPPEAPQTDPTLLPNLGEIGGELGTNLKGRGEDFSQSVAKMGQSPQAFAAGGIQALGAAAGGLGDVVNAGLQLIPGVQAAEKYLGKGIKALASTQTGQDIGKAFDTFAKENPETAKTIGAGINIAAAIPILRGIGLVKAGVADTSLNVFRSKAEKGAREEIANALTSRPAAALAKAETRGLDPIKVMFADTRFLPQVVENPSGGFMYATKDSLRALNGSIDVDEAQLQRLLDQAIEKNRMVSLADARKKVLADVRLEYPLSGNYKPAVDAVNKYFDSVVESSGGRNMISLNELNGLKRDVRSSVFDVAGDVRGTAAADVKYTMGQSLMKQVEDQAKSLNIEGVHDLNRAMAQKIETARILRALEGKNVKTKGGIGKEAIVGGGSFLAEAGATSMGLPPIAATLAGRGLASRILRRNPSSYLGRLGRYKAPKATLKSGVTSLTKGLATQEASTRATKR